MGFAADPEAWLPDIRFQGVRSHSFACHLTLCVLQTRLLPQLAAHSANPPLSLRNPMAKAPYMSQYMRALYQAITLLSSRKAMTPENDSEFVFNAICVLVRVSSNGDHAEMVTLLRRLASSSVPGTIRCSILASRRKLCLNSDTLFASFLLNVENCMFHADSLFSLGHKQADW